MSLFPAYSDLSESNTNVADEAWLQQSSFPITVPQKSSEINSKQNVDSSLSDTNDPQSTTKKHKKSKRKIKEDSSDKSLNVDSSLSDTSDSPMIEKKYKKSKKKIKKDSSDKSSNSMKCDITENDIFFIDKKPTKEFLNVKTISRPAVAKYKIHYYLIKKHMKKRKLKRFYHQLSSEDIKKSEDIEKNFNNVNFDSLQHEMELTQKTAIYNRTVHEDPKNVEMWLEFIDYQDIIFKFEKNYKKGSIAKGLRANAERKLNIIEKALSHNPNSEKLHRKRLQIMVSVYPADELQKQLGDLLSKDQGNIILWQGYIEATQCSMSHCNTSAVLKLYTSCLSTLHKIRRNSSSDCALLEENILRILYQCGLFLKQSGLFEQLWTLLKMYLEMNLGQLVQGSFDITVNLNEKKLLDLEDVVFKSQLPSHELWLRTEKLRESYHWLPVIENCEDPQRIVFAEDVVELIQPITMPENTYRLTATILTLLKIPLLPCRHSTIQELGLDYVPWALDSIESVLPIFYPIYPIQLDLGNFLSDYQLSVGPQYLKVFPGQEEYLMFILTVIEKCINCLQGEDQTSLIVWWFRFQRLLIILNDKIKLPSNLIKTMKSNIKHLLKKPENRSNILFYVEYALVEKELNTVESGLKILEIALSFVKELNFDPSQINSDQEHMCYLIRTIVETNILLEQNEKAVKYLANFVLGKTIQSKCEINEDTLKQATMKFKHVSLQLSTKMGSSKISPTKHLLPIITCDWVICNGWFIYLTKGPLECGVFLEDLLEKMNEKDSEPSLQKEIIYEFYVATMFKFCSSNPGYGLFKALDDVMNRALRLFPNNLFLLSVLAKGQLLFNSLGPKFWKIKDLALKTEHALPVLLIISMTQQTILNLHEQRTDTITGESIQIDDTFFKNTVLSLFKAATKSNICTRRCGFIWRLYLQFIHKFFDPQLCRQVYYCAVEECPWLKALYIDAAIYIPAELGQIQDLIIEKQLRLHITPEELEVLRD
ncbi:nuclear exosome regulator NRDE2 [Harmonia axyridis]|uniref:nuclear exosome regulator NRDE2 n=1 Tax=Harmonia axyridis TaxID=115357 RepID=UPI001E2776C4|nr:nuclear exosome regulator NRDE2 [Harmonia axyridis]